MAEQTEFEFELDGSACCGAAEFDECECAELDACDGSPMCWAEVHSDGCAAEDGRTYIVLPGYGWVPVEDVELPELEPIRTAPARPLFVAPQPITAGGA
ncbi:hypothetical protein [Allokutzneria albata]|uniref:Uncharacterized protein n=1 Tax=Allokutzneria albata TaxID=211114 RepID=A0A1H0DTC6_ALLAB|nr:hypothetical protein [Allokutzneria albata]SDN73241.1 hypothetical protein SAMN04489726_7977 [Allokutzneria albata]SDN74515.1 hypothetical protein SAMN04489726_8034 [Allokutzneria albata]